MTCNLGDNCNALGRSTHALLQSINCIYVALLCEEILSLMIKGCRNGDTFRVFVDCPSYVYNLGVYLRDI